MAHVESAGQAIARLNYSAERRERTFIKSGGNPDRTRRADFHHLRTVRNTRRQVRYNGAIPGFERGILGTTGSTETLEKFRALARDIGEKAGQPLLVVEDMRESGVKRALVGELTGGVHVRDGFSSGRGFMRSTVKSAQLSASVLAETEPLVSVSGDGDGGWYVRSVEVPADPRHVSVAEIELDEWASTGDPEEDFEVTYPAEGTVLLGQEAITGSELFEPDLKDILMVTGAAL